MGKKPIIIACIISAVTFVFFLISGLGMAQPGDAFYGFQNKVEKTRLQLSIFPDGRIKYAEQLLRLRSEGLVKSGGDDQIKIKEANFALVDLAASLAKNRSAEGQANQLTKFYQSVDPFIQTCCINNQNDDLLEFRKRWKAFQILIEKSRTESVDWNILTGEDSKPVLDNLIRDSIQKTAVPFTHSWLPFTGKHIGLDCKQCHLEGNQVNGNKCVDCHEPNRPADHYQLECSYCHATEGWSSASFNHPPELVTDCMTCHTPRVSHYAVNCSICHATTGWSPQNVDHTKLPDCFTCHNDQQPVNHFNIQCSTCHVTSGWSPENIDHANLIDCISCHNGKRPANHYTAQCSTCHSTNGWLPVSIDHSVQTNCENCHTRPGDHVTGKCESCHSYPSWNRSHPWFNIYHNGAGGSCSTCHPGGNAGSTDCNTCHEANDEGGDDGGGDD